MTNWFTCKYYLPCGWCELKKESCSSNNNVTINNPIITPTWTTVTTETTTATSENVMDMDSAMQTLAKGKKNG